MYTYVRWRNPKGAEKIDDVDLLAVIIITLFSPVLVVAVWLRATRRDYINPIAALWYVYSLIYQWWKEVLV